MIIRPVLVAAAVVCTALPGGAPPGTPAQPPTPAVVSTAVSKSTSPATSGVWRVRAEPPWACSPSKDGQYVEQTENGVLRAWKCKFEDGRWQWVEVRPGDIGLCQPAAMQARPGTCRRH